MTPRIAPNSVRSDLAPLDGADHPGAPLPVQGRPTGHRPDIVDLVPGDTATIAAVHAGLSVHSRYRRFQSARPVLSPGMLRRLAAVQPGRHVVHVAVQGGRPIGLIRWIRWGAPGYAELAYEVMDEAQGRGVGRALLQHAVRSAAACGIEWFVVQLAPGDETVRRRLLTCGGEPDPERPGFHRIPVRPEAADAPPDAGRGAAAVP